MRAEEVHTQKNECCVVTLCERTTTVGKYTHNIGGRRLFIIDLRFCNTAQEKERETLL